MQRVALVRPLAWRIGVRHVSTFAELYGREPDEDSNQPSFFSGSTGIPSTVCTGATASPSTSSPSPPAPSSTREAVTAASLLKEYDDQLYVDPSCQRPQTAYTTLRALRTHLQHTDSNTSETGRDVAAVWLKALSILDECTATPSHLAEHANKDHDLTAALQATCECVTLLWLTRPHRDAARTLAEDTLLALTASFSSPSTACSDQLPTVGAYCAAATLLAVCVLGGAEAGIRLNPSLVHLCEAVLRDSKERAHVASQEDKSHVAQVCAVLVWALDWMQHFAPEQMPPHWSRRALRARALPWMTHTFDDNVTVDSALSPQSPPSHLVKAADGDETDSETLKRLYMSAVTRTRDMPPLCLFELPTRLGEVVLAAPAVPAPTQLAVLRALGPALSPAAVQSYALSHRAARGTVNAALPPFEAAVEVLARMCGPDAYHALRRVQNAAGKPNLLAHVQQVHGDVLSPDAGVTWETALCALEHAMRDGDARWRHELPTTLRLLADAQKPAAFFSLLAEYRPDGVSNGVVAASLASTARHTGRWWHALEVLDLIATADTPRSESDDLFLRDAALETLSALRHAQRWAEALAVSTALKPLLAADAKEASSILWSTVAEMPPGAPWATAASLLADSFTAPKSATTLLALTRGDVDQKLSKLPRGHATRRRLFFLLSSHGRWQTLASALSLPAVSDPVDQSELSRHILRALQHRPADTDVGEVRRLLSALPLPVMLGASQSTAAASSMLRHLFRACQRVGCLDLLATRMQDMQQGLDGETVAPRTLTLCGEYSQLLSFLLDMSRTQTTPHTTAATATGTSARKRSAYVIRDSFVARQFLHHYTTSPFRLQYMLSRDALRPRHGRLPSHKRAATIQLARELRCRPDQVRLSSRSPGSALLFPPTPVSFSPDHLYMATDRAVVAFKPFGAVFSTVAQAALQGAELCAGVWGALFDMPPGWSGLFMLRPATSPRLGVRAEMTLIVRVLALTQEAVPLMATTWWRTYAAGVYAEDTEVSTRGLTVTSTVHTDGVETVEDAIHAWRAQLNAEGWGLVEGEGGVSGESVHIAGLTLDACGESQIKTITTALPHWLQPPPTAPEARGEDAFDEMAFLRD